MKKLILTVVATLALGASQVFADDYPYTNLATGGTPSYSGAQIHANGCNGTKTIGILFDNDGSTRFAFQNAPSDGSFHIQYELPEAKVLNAYGIQCADGGYSSATGRAPKTFSFEAYDEGLGEWVTLDTRASETGWSETELRVYKFANATAYRKYRLTQTAPTGYTGFAELQFYYIDTRDTLVVESDAENFGTPNPGYGTHTETVGGVVTCTLTGADQSYEGADGNEYKFFGYEVWGNADTPTPELISSGDLPSVTYRQESYTKVVWKWYSPTRNLAVLGTVSATGGSRQASNPGNATVSVLCDNDVATFYGFTGVKTDGSFQVVNTLPSPTVVNAYALQCARPNSVSGGYYDNKNRAPRTFSFEGYDESEGEWVTLDARPSETGWLDEQERLYKFTNTTPYKKYRLVVTAPSGSVGFAELKFFYIDSRDVLKVESDVEEFGTPDPAYGEHEGQPIGGEVTCTIAGADETYTSTTGGKYVFAGYEVWGKADTGTPELIDAGTETNVTYTQSSYTKLVWKWGMAPMRVATDGNDNNNGFDAPKATISAAVTAASVAGQVIEVGDGEYPITAALAITKNVIVRAAHPGKATVTGAGTHKLLTLNHASARVEGIVFRNGYATGSTAASPGAGSGVEITAGTLANSTVTGCTGADYGCPAVWLKGAGAKLSGCTVSNNVVRCTNTNNRYYITRCGGVGLTAGLVENCLIAENRGGSSAGVWQSGGTVTGCTVVRNVGSHEQTGETKTVGAAEACAWGTVFVKGGTFKDSTIAYNTVASAAGAYVIGSGKLSGCTVAFNHATMDRPLVIDAGDMILSENQPTWIGGRIPVGGVVLGASGATVENCTIATNTAVRGGSDQGLFVIAGTATGNTLDANGEDLNSSASTSFEAFVVPDDGLTGEWPYDTPAKAARSVQAAVDAVAASRGQPGTVHVAAGDYSAPPDGWMLVLKRPVRVVGPATGTATFQPAATGRGYGIWVGDRDATLSRVTVKGFKAYADDASGSGWAFAAAAGVLCSGTLDGVTVTGSKQDDYSAATSLLVLDGRMANCIVSKNMTSGNGGTRQLGTGVRQYGGIVEDCLFEGNVASCGGGAAVCSSKATLRRCRFVGNTATGYNNGVYGYPGAGIYLAAGSVESCLIVSNKATSTSITSPHGAGVYMSGGTLANCTVCDNVNAKSGYAAGVYLAGGSVTNSIVWRNVSGEAASDIVAAGGKQGLNWTENPKFRGKGANPFRLAAGSPCLGVGDAELWTAEDRDLIGNPRTVHGAVDLGCYQTRETGLMLMVR